MENNDLNEGSKENEISKKLLDAEFEELFKRVDDKSSSLNVKGEEIGTSENLLSDEDCKSSA